MLRFASGKVPPSRFGAKGKQGFRRPSAAQNAVDASATEKKLRSQAVQNQITQLYPPGLGPVKPVKTVMYSSAKNAYSERTGRDIGQNYKTHPKLFRLGALQLLGSDSCSHESPQAVQEFEACGNAAVQNLMGETLFLGLSYVLTQSKKAAAGGRGRAARSLAAVTGGAAAAAGGSAAEAGQAAEAAAANTIASGRARRKRARAATVDSIGDGTDTKLTAAPAKAAATPMHQTAAADPSGKVAILDLSTPNAAAVPVALHAAPAKRQRRRAPQAASIVMRDLSTCASDGEAMLPAAGPRAAASAAAAAPAAAPSAAAAAAAAAARTAAAAARTAAAAPAAAAAAAGFIDLTGDAMQPALPRSRNKAAGSARAFTPKSDSEVVVISD